MKEIPLRNKKHEILAFTLVDDEDFDRITDFGPWCLGVKGYVVTVKREGKKKHTYRLHRFVLNLKSSDPHVDHWDGNVLNNQKNNLIISSTTLEGRLRDSQNRTFTGGSSIYRGVSYSPFIDGGKPKLKPWYAQGRSTQMDGSIKSFHKWFLTEEEAAEAVQQWRAENMPFTNEDR